jgi:hypothetical protein
VYWNPQVRAFGGRGGDYSLQRTTTDRRRAAINQGFTVAMTVPRIGMFRGQTAVVSLGDGTVADRVIRPGVAQSMTLWRDNSAGGGYPTSAMGAMAFIRQTLHDADWHARAHAAYQRNPQALRRPESNAALAALAPALRGEQPLLVETRSEEELLRALAWGVSSRCVSGSAAAAASTAAGAVPRHERAADPAGQLPAAPDVARPEQALNLSLAQLRHWQQAPENPGGWRGRRPLRPDDGRPARTVGQFLPNVRTRSRARASRRTWHWRADHRAAGVPRHHAHPRHAREAGKVANVVVANGDVFTPHDARVEAVWIDGRRFEVTAGRRRPARPVARRGDRRRSCRARSRCPARVTALRHVRRHRARRRA